MGAMRAYIGGATSGQGSPASGIVIVDVDGPKITEVGRGAEQIGNPMYQAVSASGEVLYTVHETDPGLVSAWAVEDATLRPLGRPRPSGGTGPCHLSLHPGGGFLLVANYGNGTFAVLPVRVDGALGEAVADVQLTGSGPVVSRQRSSHAHQVIVDPGEGPARGHVLVTDLGADRGHRYLLDASTGELAEVDVANLAAGSGPRHLVVSGQHAYVAGELDSTVTVLDLTTSPPAAVSTVSTVDPSARTGSAVSQPSAIRVSADHRFLYVVNRGVDEIAVLTVDGPEVSLVGSVSSGGTHPRDLEVSPDGAYVFAANQFDDTVVSFAADPDSGLLTPTGDVFETGSPANITFAPA